MKYLNAVLTVIAVCLVLITFAITGLIPSANAKENPRSISVPLNPDGSINVRLPKGETIDVNIDEIGGTSQSGRTLDINIDEIEGSSLSSKAFPVNIQEVGGYDTYGKVPVVVK
jgi:hypothetical protein